MKTISYNYQLFLQPVAINLNCLRNHLFKICLLSILFLNTLSSQNFCSTTGWPNSPGILPQGLGLQPGPFTLKVYMHIIRRSNGFDGITLSQLEESKAYLAIMQSFIYK